MSWNEPGGDKKDPWSGRDNQKGPPDLDEALKSLQEKLGGLFGGRGEGNGDGSSGGGLKSLGYLAAGALALWGISGFYIVDEGWRGVETRFGRYTEETTQPGLRWHFPMPIEQVQLVNIGQQRIIEIGYRSGGGRQQPAAPGQKDTLMLTTDENIVDVRLAVQYQVIAPEKFVFNVLNPEQTLRQVTESAQRGVIGKSEMDFILTEGRSEIATEIQKEIQKIIDDYQIGVRITNVNLQDAQAPEEVMGAFKDVIKAREDKQRLINEAEAYSNDVVPKAGGAAARKKQEAEGYKAKVVAQAEGEASRFGKLLAEYKKAPEVTRKRLYIEAIESVLQNTDTALIDVKGGNNVFYLPLDKVTHAAPAVEENFNIAEGNVAQPPQSAAVHPQPLRNTVRGREPRGRLNASE